MTPAPLRVTDPAAARALRQHHAFLALFLHPQSPSDVAGRAGMAANLAHHHARKLVALGLLREQRREGGRVYYQLSAQEFRVPWSVMPPVDGRGGELSDLTRLTDAFRHAYARSYLATGNSEERIVAFADFSGSDSLPDLPRPPTDSRPAESHPTHLDALILRLSPARYRSLVRALSGLLEDAMNEPPATAGEVCTLTVLAHQGGTDGDEQAPGISRITSSFLGAE